MQSASNDARIEQAQTIKLKHRIPWTLHDDVCQGSIIDTVEPSIKRASAIADLLEIAAEQDGGGCLNGELLRHVGQAIRLELEDAAAFLECYDKRDAASNGSNQP
ncbi:hypothetical protein [Methylomonas sp. UP202]|uniref:hypothetical protein n=1 Tax=Methylomonas sp. UP202 TaxID=3040943 RepID=UPI00247A7F41|nr:hypothetical protein [Methylomonas sp. UP202]WGS84318.1 hypothetical protein QC632_14805 [Methylomonas sp. UP202]WGS86634.1 hypothetical protein QC632_02485 [Methylomonas sp. UP202]